MKFGFKNKFGLSFSWKRLLGIQGIKNSFARKCEKKFFAKKGGMYTEEYLNKKFQKTLILYGTFSHFLNTV